MRLSYRQHLLEYFIYGIIWLFVFILPLTMIYFHGSRIHELETSRILGHCFSFWLEILPYFCIFLINNYVLSPLLLFKKRHLAYVVSVFVCVVTVLWLFSVLSELWFVYGDPELMFMRRGRFDWDQGMRHPEQLFEDSPPIPVPPFIPFLRFVVAFLIIGFNVAIKLYFKSLQDDRDLMELRHRQLESELRYLKYQVNPHFFMNTLNNIHALVDINAERAKEAIIELSKLMRYVLYESGNNEIPLASEIRFLKNYVELMRLRYNPDLLRVTTDFPLVIPEVRIPSLLFVPVLENAFKHGVSYREPSFIDVSVHMEDAGKISFRCRNSDHSRGKERETAGSGIGLENLRKRLKLHFDNDYVLLIKNEDNCYEVLLIIPFYD